MTAHHIEKHGPALRVTCLFALLLAGAGCSAVRIVAMNDNYVTLLHPFTDAGTESARVLAARECRMHSQVAVKTSDACSLTLCTTNFQCMEPAEAKQYQQ